MQQNWKELADLTGYEVEKLYQSVRQEALRELAFQELAVTRILKDLIEIRKHSQTCRSSHRRRRITLFKL